MGRDAVKCFVLGVALPISTTSKQKCRSCCSITTKLRNSLIEGKQRHLLVCDFSLHLDRAYCAVSLDRDQHGQDLASQRVKAVLWNTQKNTITLKQPNA